MADEQPAVPSTGAPADAASAAEASTTSAAEPEDRSWWHRLTGRLPRTNGASGDEQEPNASNGASGPVTLTQEELDRRVQAETDRREARRQQQAAFEQRRRLRDEDPYAYAEQERQAEQQQVDSQNWQQFFGNIGAQHDRAAIDPVVNQLDASEQQRIMKLQGAGVGLEGRTLVVTEALKALERKWKAEGARQAEARLRKDATFRRQVFAQHRGAMPEPDLMPPGGATPSEGSVSDILRQSLGQRRGTG